MDVQVNVWGVLAAAASSMVVGSIWYAQAVFGKTWMRLAKVKTDGRGSMVLPLALTFIASLLTAYVIAHVAYLSNQFFDHSFLQDAVVTSLWLWLGLTAARFLTHDLFEGRPTKLTLLNVGNEFVTIVLMGVVIGLIGV
jgi:hypothetical protein